MRSIFSCLIVLFFACPGFGQVGVDVKGWTQDVNQYRRTVSKKHKDPFSKTSKEEFNMACDLLIEGLPQLTEAQIKVKLCRIAASIGDAHTTIRFNPESLYPVSFYWFDDGIKLFGIDPEHEELIGARLLYINDVPVEQVVAMLSTIISHENQAQLKSQVPGFLGNVDILVGLGIVKDPSQCSYTFDTTTKNQPEITVCPVPMSKFQEYRKTMKWVKPEKELLANQQSSKFYWYKVLEKENAVFVQYRSCRQMENYFFAEFVKDVMVDIDKMDKPKLIIDLRGNGGGNSAIFKPMLDAISKRFFLNQPDKLYVLIGRRTFSSAILNAMDLRNETNATLVGEPTGGKPNHFGEVKSDKLKNSGLQFTWSIKYFTVTEGDPESIFPDNEITRSYHDYHAGKDNVLEWVLSQ